MNHFESDLKQRSEEIKIELKAIDIDSLIENNTEYYNIENNIKRIEKRGIKAEKLRSDLIRFKEKAKAKFQENKLEKIAWSRINDLDKLYEELKLDNIKSSIIAGLANADAFLTQKNINKDDVNVILFEDCSGYGNLSIYGFSGKLFPFNESATRFDDILFEGVGEIDMTSCYAGLKEIEKKESAIPIYFISRLLTEYSDLTTRLLLNKALESLYLDKGFEMEENKLFRKKDLSFYHVHHDEIEVLIYKNER